MSKNNKISIGKKGEKFASLYLSKLGYRILAHNYTTPLGEIDLIAEKESCLFFCEVKTRTSSLFGEGVEAISPSKVSRIKKAAEIYLSQVEDNREVRIMAISILWGDSPTVEIFLF